jgi:hypothetical protein
MASPEAGDLAAEAIETLNLLVSAPPSIHPICRSFFAIHSLTTRIISPIPKKQKHTHTHIQGILESQREELHRSKRFLLAALKAYELLAPLAQTTAVMERRSPDAPFRRPLQGPYTLSHFYLAQVYGQLGDPKTGASYCYRTLALQVDTMTMGCMRQKFFLYLHPPSHAHPRPSPHHTTPQHTTNTNSWRARRAWTC